jgi:hypothetical protein
LYVLGFAQAESITNFKSVAAGPVYDTYRAATLPAKKEAVGYLEVVMHFPL